MARPTQFDLSVAVAVHTDSNICPSKTEKV